MDAYSRTPLSNLTTRIYPTSYAQITPTFQTGATRFESIACSQKLQAAIDNLGNLYGTL
jgi:hypothetical protein